MAAQHTNRLIQEASPYLLQHAHNPVDWYPWGNEALEKARAENKVILVSIGYSACHWCHVMERESFEDPAVAQLMNDHFVNIKIDREERPDIDHIYMDAVQAITGSGGWPLNVFLTPDTRPFYGGTYFPPKAMYNRSSWTDVLNGVQKAWMDRLHEINAQAENLTQHLQQSNQKGSSYTAQDLDAIVAAGSNDAATMLQHILATADTTWGGFGKAPKFPQTFTIQWLLQYHHFYQSEPAFNQALLSLDKMLQGGIYDHVGGGLARYSTDQEWLAPHFEKMLYDNALLLNVLADAYQITQQYHYKKAMLQIIDFLSKELSSPEGGYYAALDADSEGEEGKFYVWTLEEIKAVLGNDAAHFAACFDVTASGNWEGVSIVRLLQSTEAYALQNGLDAAEWESTVTRCLDLLYTARSKRVRPGLDNKIITSWNAMLVKAFAKVGLALQSAEIIQMAENLMGFIRQNLIRQQPAEQGWLMHTFKPESQSIPAFLDDYALLADAALALYEASFDVSYIELAKRAVEYVCLHFGSEESPLFYFTQQQQTDVLIQKAEVYDGATPSGNSIMASVLFRLSILLNKEDWKQRALEMLAMMKDKTIKYPGSFGVWANLMVQIGKNFEEIVVVGTDAKKNGN